jgi:AraC-like DNA-binding protein
MAKWIIKRNLIGVCPDIKTVAIELGMSSRTLQRRLIEEGTSFNHILTQIKHDQAIEYLSDFALDMKEIAFMIGYEDKNSFFRAFRLWEGDTPSNWRAKHLEKIDKRGEKFYGYGIK